MVRTSSIPKRHLWPALAILVLLASGTVPCHAAIDETIPDAQTIAQLEHRAAEAAPREQCYLYTELVHILTELAGQQLLDGQPELATASLQRVERYAELVHNGIAADTKRVKEAEKLMSHTTRRLSDYLHHAATEDRPALMATFVHLDHVHEELLNQVFAR